MKKLLLIGPLTNKRDRTKTGGVTVLFELLLSELSSRNIEFDVIDTYKENYFNVFVAYLVIVIKLITKMPKYDHISLQATANSYIMIGPIMIFMAKLLNKKTSVRKFAGNFNEIHAQSNYMKKCVIEYVLKNSDCNFFETKYLVEYFEKYNVNTYWFPNVRKMIIEPMLPRAYKKRFVFIGTICEEKGIDELCHSIQKLPKDYVIDIYGPIRDKKYSQNYFKEMGINYKGALRAEDAIGTLNKYDVLILPSHREGYPGIIIEAFSLGIPVVATKLAGIQEMIEHNVNGLLIDVNNSIQLQNAVLSINKNNYLRLSEEAFKSFDNFNSDLQTNIFLKIIME